MSKPDYVGLGFLAAAVAGLVGFVGLSMKYPSTTKAVEDGLNEQEARRRRFMRDRLAHEAQEQYLKNFARDLAFLRQEERLIRMRSCFSEAEKEWQVEKLYALFNVQYSKLL